MYKNESYKTETDLQLVHKDSCMLYVKHHVGNCNM